MAPVALMLMSSTIVVWLVMALLVVASDVAQFRRANNSKPYASGDNIFAKCA